MITSPQHWTSRRHASRWLWVMLAVLVPSALTSTTASAGHAAPWSVWQDPLSLPRQRDDHTVVQWSSFSPAPCGYDGAGQVLPDQLDCRYDHLYRPLGRHRQLREEGDELILVDERGAGALVRMWLTTGEGFSADFPTALRLRIRLDGDPVPWLDAPVSELFGGGITPFLWPLVADRHSAVGASFSYVPVVFNRGLRISLAGPVSALDANRIWYQFNVQRVAVDVDIGDSGFPGDLAAWQAFAATAPGTYPWPAALDWQAGSASISDGEHLSLLDVDASGTVLALRLRVADEAHWQQLRLLAQFDDEPIIDQSLAAWFGLGDAADQAPTSLLVGRASDGFAYLYWPMPFHRAARLTLHQPAGSGVADVDVALALDDAAPPPDAMPFTVIAQDDCVPGARQQPDLTLLDLHGRGRWLGLVSRQSNLLQDNANYLEGDERVYVDGSPHAAWHGTGNEDFYNAGFYFDRDGYGFVQSLPLSGATWHRMLTGSPVASQMYRLLLTDAVPFRSRLTVRLERGAYGDQPMCARSTGYAYHQAPRAQAPVAALDLADPQSVSQALYQAPLSAQCELLHAAFVDEPPTWRTGRVCRFASGESGFRLVLPQATQRMWLRRRFDAQLGGQAATVWHGDAQVGHVPYAQANPYRRWQDVDVPLALPAQSAGAALDLRVVPDADGTPFTESAYWLLADVGDVLFADGFEAR